MRTYKKFKVLVNGIHGIKEFHIQALNNDKACKIGKEMYANVTYCDESEVGSAVAIRRT